MKYKELKNFLENLENTEDEIVSVDKFFLVGIIKEAMIYRKQNAVNARTKLVREAMKNKSK